ncbi:MAG: hypothetical protein K9G62_01995 [Alphaproteobacteria bacterium]|nr:hypothetical protein [Alphaproteobacteria bacterium]
MSDEKKKKGLKGVGRKGKKSPKRTDLTKEGILTPDEEIAQAVAHSAVRKKKANTRKRNMKYAVILGGILFFSYGVYQLFIPHQGTIGFGVCKVFLEQNVQYPHTLHLSKVEQFSTSVRIWFTQTDSFGEYRMEPIQCFFRAHEEWGFELDKVTIRRRELDPAIVERFNPTIPYIKAAPPDLSLPMPLPDSLENLKIDLSRYIKPIF